VVVVVVVVASGVAVVVVASGVAVVVVASGVAVVVVVVVVMVALPLRFFVVIVSSPVSPYRHGMDAVSRHTP
jgi:hypothetical protein